MTAARIARLTLTGFRSYRTASLSAGPGLVVLTGANGAGKTNILEAVSLLTPGRGLRRATLADLAHDPGDGQGVGRWAIAAEVEGRYGLVLLGTGLDGEASGPETRKCRIDREPVGSAAAFADHLAVVWMTPAMDGLFLGSASERRRFVDRLVLAVDASHGSRVSALERALRSRNRLLEDARADPVWLDAVEHETAELAVAVAAARAETVQRLSAHLQARRDPASPFPWAEIGLDGWMEGAVGAAPSRDIEDRYRATLKAARPRDAAAGRTLDGPHLTDLLVRHGPKGMPAEACSTGEQKAMLTGLILAHAELVAGMTGQAPVILLDEVAAHLDPYRRAALFERLRALGAQVWMTGADPAAFAGLTQADLFEVTPGCATKLSA
jgi:DNA replication and repair protein RecF